MEHLDDPITLMRVVVVIAFFMALAWVSGAALLRMSPAVAHRFAVGNVLFAVGVYLTTLRVADPQFLTYQGADFAELVGLTLLRSGLQRFAERPVSYTEHFIALAAAALSTSLLPAQPTSLAQMGVAFSFAAGWITLRAFWEMQASLAPQLRLAPRLGLLWPVGLFGIFMVLRGVNFLVVRNPGLVDVRLDSPSTVTLFWVVIVVLIATNTSFIGLVIARLIAHIAASSQRDSLTGVLNHSTTLERIEAERQRQRRRGPPFAIAMFDLDHFKQVNDRYGHGCGDAALRHVTRLVAPMLRVSDSIGRLGGEEFLIILPMTDLAGALIAAERIRSRLSQNPFEWNRTVVLVTASFGVAQSQDGDEAVEALMHRADQALYRAKDAGRNRVEAAPLQESMDGAAVPGAADGQA